MESGVVPGFFPFLGWAIFLGALGLSIALGMILSFHWYRYAMNRSVAMIATVIYGAGCFLVLSMLFGSVLSLS